MLLPLQVMMRVLRSRAAFMHFTIPAFKRRRVPTEVAISTTTARRVVSRAQSPKQRRDEAGEVPVIELREDGKTAADDGAGDLGIATDERCQ